MKGVGFKLNFSVSFWFKPVASCEASHCAWLNLEPSHGHIFLSYCFLLKFYCFYKHKRCLYLFKTILYQTLSNWGTSWVINWSIYIGLAPDEMFCAELYTVYTVRCTNHSQTDILILHLWLYTLCTLCISVQVYKCTVLLYSNSLTHREVKLAQCPWSDLWLGLMPSLLFTVHFTLYTVHCTLYTVHSTLYTVHCTLYSVHCTLYTVHFTLYTVHWTDAFLTPPVRSQTVKWILAAFQLKQVLKLKSFSSSYLKW